MSFLSKLAIDVGNDEDQTLGIGPTSHAASLPKHLQKALHSDCKLGLVPSCPFPAASHGTQADAQWQGGHESLLRCQPGVHRSHIEVQLLVGHPVGLLLKGEESLACQSG